MALDLIYTAADSEHVVRFTQSEWESLTRLQPPTPSPIDTLLTTSVFGESITATAGDLEAAATAVLELLRSQRDSLPATFQMRAELLPYGHGPDGTWQGGGIGGLRLPDDSKHFYEIWVGIDRCELSKIGIGPDGRGVVLSREDIRNCPSLQTETVGRIDFRRRPADSSLRKKLTALRDFLEQQSGKQVSRMLC